MQKILIIDDDVTALKLLGYTLRKAGFEIIVAQNGFEGLEKAESQIPDLIVTDLMMPKMDGYEVARRLRGRQNTEHIPIIMLTAKSQVADKVIGFEAGVNDYVTKPVMLAELIARIKAHLSHPSGTAPLSKAKTISFIGAKGGVGLTTLVVNAGLILQSKQNQVILADFHTDRGTVSHQLGLNSSNDLLNLLKKSPAALTPEALIKSLLSHPSGLKSLPPIHGLSARYRTMEPVQAKTILQILDPVADYLLVDLGTTIDRKTEFVLRKSHLICLVAEPTMLALNLAKGVLQYINDIGLSSQHSGAIIVNRSRSARTFTRKQIRDILKINLFGIISPAPELAFQASRTKTPMIKLQPKHITSKQIEELIPIFTQ